MVAVEAGPSPRSATAPRGAATVDGLNGRRRRSIGGIAFLGLSLTSLGGPLALAALYAPAIVAGRPSGSAGFVALAGSVAFAVPLAVWLRYSRTIADSGGLYAFVKAAAGRRVALVQAALWVFSYLLYLVYTTASVVYETLPDALPGVRPYRPLLEIAIPVVLAAVMLAGRAVTLVVIGALAAGQLVLVGALASVTVGHDAAPLHSFAIPATGDGVANASGQLALLFVCGSLPLFLGGEVTRPRRTIRRGLIGGYLLTAAGVALVIFPLARNPAFLHEPIPGMSVAQVFSGHALAVAIGVGVAVSTVGVMLVEFLALSRLLCAVLTRPPSGIIRILSAVLVLTAPLTLLAPVRIYEDLLKPSLVALWLSQFIVFAAYPRFARRGGRTRRSDWALSLGAAAFAGFGFYSVIWSGGS